MDISLTISLDKKQEILSFNSGSDLYSFIVKSVGESDDKFIFANVDKGDDFCDAPVVVLSSGLMLMSYINEQIETEGAFSGQNIQIHSFDDYSNLLDYLNIALH